MSELVVMMRGALAWPLRQIGLLGGIREDALAPSREAGGRLYALDLARFIAMCFMMQGHVLDALVTREAIVITDFPWSIWHVIRGFTAPTFLMVSGAVHAFATKRYDTGVVREDVIARRIRWGLTIMGIGYFMMFPAGNVWDLAFVPDASWRAFFNVNILQLTGATMLLFVLVMAGTRSVKQLGRRAMWTMIAILALTPFMKILGEQPGIPLWLNAYLNTSTGSLFPIFPFSAYLFAGLVIGARLKEIDPDKRDAALKKYSWRLGGLVLLVALLANGILAQLGVSHESLETNMSITLFFRRVGIVLIFFSVSVLILERTWALREWWAMFGKKSLWIYVIHLVLLYGTQLWTGPARLHYRELSLQEGLYFVALIGAATLFIAWMADLYSRQEWAKRNSSKVQAVLIAYIAFISACVASL